MERFLPIGVGGLSTIAASILDTNFGTVAAGITALSTAIGAGIWQVSSRKTAAFKEAEAARREAYRDDEMAKIEIQRQRDQLNKDSLSARLDQMGAQLTMIQRSADEANRSLEDARQFNAALRASLDDANRKVEESNRKIEEGNRRVEDANRKLHDLLNEANAKSLVHEAEKLELQEIRAELMGKLDKEHAENRAKAEEIRMLTQRLGDAMLVAKATGDLNSEKIARNSEKIDRLTPPPSTGPPVSP